MKSLPQGELQRYLNKIDKVFSIDSLLNQEIDFDTVVKYYKQSNYGYSLVHSSEGSVHMALNVDGEFDKDGYYEQARFVNNEIQDSGVRNILELACGKGFNSIYLAKENPELNFNGIDLTPTHLEQAKESGKDLSNLYFSLENFQQLSFEDEIFDLLFEVESICHATNMKSAISEANRVLRPGGRFVLFDGFRKKSINSFDSNIEIASKLVEISMAISQGWVINDWLEIVQQEGFKVIEVSDISEAIMPNLIKFQVLARGYFKSPKVAKSILRVMPSHLVKNSIAGLLMPFTISEGAQGYYRIVLERTA